MKTQTLLAAALAVSALAGCDLLNAAANPVGVPAGPGTPATKSPTAFDDDFNALGNRPVTTQPVTGTANYVGEMAILAPNTASAGGTRVTNDDNTVIGDLEMTVDFAPGATNPVTGTAKNFAGKVGGQDVALDGELTTANHIDTAGTINNTVATATAAGPTGTLTTTSVSASFQGTLTDASNPSGLAGDVTASILAPTLGPVPTGASIASGDAQAMRGPVQVFIDPTTGMSVTTAGSFYVIKQ